ncbi:MAG: type III-B CRISPR module RAMP protein Cmr4 [Ktedonobacteraceae bacterium]|nr:type III-B CRISPR module RAMP protein Cmr4 [Ktedonobacteraceae bacterium]
MITETTMLYLYVETPLHAGTGSGLSSIDLPIQRERTTQYPMIQGSSIKGKLRSVAEEVFKGDPATVNTLFGPPATGSSDHAGALIIGDARILLFPVRSLNGVFAYTTSYDVLNRFKRDIERGRTTQPLSWDVPSPVEKALVTTSSDLHSKNQMVLEEFSFETQADKQVDTIAKWIAKNTLPPMGTTTYWSNKIQTSLAILPDDDFRDFALYATEIITRIRLDRQKKTVERGALWTEEHLPTDTLLYVPVYATDARLNGKTGTQMTASEIIAKARAMNAASNNYLQLGGDETVGRGIVRIHWETHNNSQSSEDTEEKASDRANESTN